MMWSSPLSNLSKQHCPPRLLRHGGNDYEQEVQHVACMEGRMIDAASTVMSTATTASGCNTS